MVAPIELGNRHYKRVQEWIAEDGVVESFETIEEIVAREKVEANQVIYEELEALDKASIRDIREWITAQPTAPPGLIDREDQAIAHRANIV